MVFIVSDLKVLLAGSVIAMLSAALLPYRKLRTGMVPISVFLFVTFITNALFIPGRIVLGLGPLLVTEEGISIAMIRSLKVLLLIYGAKLLTMISTLDESIKALGGILSPLEKIGVPVKELFDTMALSVKILPVVRKRIAEEYVSRSVEEGKKGIRGKAYITYKFLMPVFFRSIRDPGSFLSDETTSGPGMS